MRSIVRVLLVVSLVGSSLAAQTPAAPMQGQQGLTDGMFLVVFRKN